ncbi:VIT1/CCC1 transporter family protein [Candidatus Parcubacteria bacterium]|nr:VIT1/CCC1 transporter family protein [Candidatus Parcubacteria bacterium]
MNNHSLKIGISFGLTSGIITTLGLVVGLNAGTHSKVVIIGGILTIAVADAFSDALGIHVSEEAENKHSEKEIWESTLCTFLAKFIFAISFVIPIILLPLETAIIVSIICGLSLLSVFSFYIADTKNGSRWKAVVEHLSIAIVVIILTDYIGNQVQCLTEPLDLV